MTGGDILLLVLDLVSAALLAAGGFFYLVGMIGLNRMPDVFSRMHAASVSETLGLGLLFAGMALQAGFTLVLVKLAFIFAALFLAAPVATHALARAALHDGERPLLEDEEGRLVETDPVELFPELEARLGEPLSSEAVDVEAVAEIDGKEAQPSNS